MFFKSRRRRRLKARPLKREWEAILWRRVAAYRRLSAEQRAELHGHIQVFLAEKDFEGCAGEVVTDEMRVVIAAQACVLLLGRETDYFPLLTSVLVYPRGYTAVSTRQGPGGVVHERLQPRAGESWQASLSPLGGGPVIVSWSDTLAGVADDRDGRNLIYHECAHQLDAESGSMEGAPRLESRAAYAEWAKVWNAEFARHRRELQAGRATVLGAYAATNPAEFFAVSVERFFERPTALREHHPALYAQLAAYFKQDPAMQHEAAEFAA